MPLHDTDALQIEVATAAESLPDPATVPFRTHRITNTGPGPCLMSSVGATPFLVHGTPAAGYTIQRGMSVQLASDGTRWIVFPESGRRVFAAAGVTDAGGNVTFTFTPPFPVAPVVSGQVGPSADTALVESRLTAVSAASATFNVRRSPSVVVLGLSVLQVPANAPGVTVQCVAVEPGQV